MAVIIHGLRVSAWPCLARATSVVVRLVDAADAAAIRSVVAACRGHDGFGHGLSSAGLVVTAPSSNRTVCTWLAEEPDGRPVAAVGLAATEARERTRWSIPFLLVSPAARRRGVATGLVRELLQAAAAAGAEEVMVETLTTWADAAAFWDRVTTTLDAADVRASAAGSRPD